VNEGPVSAQLKSAFIDVGGFERWPVDLVDHPPLPQIEGADLPYDGTPMTIHVGAGVDATPGVDEADWYVSQRSDDPAKQYLAVTQTAASPGQTRSKAIDLIHTPLAESEFGVALGVRPTPDQLINLFRYVHIYFRFRSSSRIKWVDLLKAQTTRTAA
jgi:hypothetical protein